VAIVAVAVAGLGLFGTGVHGLAQLDGELADGATTAPTREVKRELGPRGDCPERDHAPLNERRL
jgi:hypothetical protein